MALEIDAGEVGGGDFDAGRIRIGVDLGTDLEAGFGGGGGDQLDNDLMADERFAAPVLGDEREEAVLDLVPLAGTRRQVADSDGGSSSSASFCSSTFQKRSRAPLLPPPSAVMVR